MGIAATRPFIALLSAVCICVALADSRFVPLREPEMAPWVGKASAPQPEEAVPDPGPFVPEESPVREEPPSHAKLGRSFRRSVAAPFYSGIFLGGVESMPPGGRKAAEYSVAYMFDGIDEPYWEGDLFSDLDLKSEDMFYRALVLRIPRWMMKRTKNIGESELLPDALDFYRARSGTVNPFVAAEFASAFAEWHGGSSHMAQQQMRTNLWEAATRAVADSGLCSSGTVECVFALLCRWGLHESREFLERLERRADAVDPWLMEMLRGTVAYRAAWKSRGSGFAVTVTQDGWKGYGRQIEEAERHLRRAFALRPDILASSSALCRLESPDATSKEQDSWYEAAMAARPDARAPRYSRLFHRTSRWGGSIREMELELDRIAPVDGDFGTMVPAYNVSLRWQCLSRLECDERDGDSREEFFRSGEVCKKTLAVIREYLKPGSSLWLERPSERDDILCDFAAAAYSCGDYPLAVECRRRITPCAWGPRFSDWECERPFAYSEQTMRSRLPFLADASRRPNLFSALCSAYAALDGGDSESAFAKLSAIGGAEPAGSGVRRQTSADLALALYNSVVRDGKCVSLMDDLLTDGDTSRYRSSKRIPENKDPSRTSFRVCPTDTWYSMRGIRRDFSGTTDFTVVPVVIRGTLIGMCEQLDFWLGPTQLTSNKTQPVLHIYRFGANGEWRAYVWEKTRDYDLRWSKYNDAVLRRLVEERKFMATNHVVEIGVRIRNGAVTYLFNGEKVNPAPLRFDMGGENDWYPFNFRQRSVAVVRHTLGPAADEAPDDPDESMPELPPFDSQERLLPLPTLAYATNGIVAAVAEKVGGRFLDGGRMGPWWAVEFNSSEMKDVQTNVANRLLAALDNDVWKSIPESWRGHLALRFAALAHQVGEKGLAAEYIVRYVPKSLIGDSRALDVADPRYDEAGNPGSHSRELRLRLWGNCTALRAALWRAKRAGGSVEVDAGTVFHTPRCEWVGGPGRYEYTGYVLPEDEDWRISVHANGPVHLLMYNDSRAGVPDGVRVVRDKKDGSLAALATRNVVEKGGRVRQATVFGPMPFRRNEDGTFVLELANEGGELSCRIDGKAIPRVEPLEPLPERPANGIGSLRLDGICPYMVGGSALKTVIHVHVP